MSLDLRINATTTRVKSEFWKSWNQVAKPAPWESVTTEVPSDTLIETYLNNTPVPGFQLWNGTRQYGGITTFPFQVRNETFSSGIQATLENIEDDQTGLLMAQPRFLAQKAKQYPGRMVQKLLGQGLGATVAFQSPTIGNLNAFDGIPFFTNRAIGGSGFGYGNNLISYASQVNDSKTYNLAALFTASDYLKPLCWQRRSGPDFETIAGSPMSKEARAVRWWCDLRGAPFFSWWFNAVGVNITGTPSVADMHAIFSAVIAQFRQFQLPKTMATEDGEYIHEQTQFDAGNLCYVASTYLSEQLEQALNETWVPQNIGGNTVATTNKWNKKASYFCTRFLDNF